MSIIKLLKELTFSRTYHAWLLSKIPLLPSSLRSLPKLYEYFESNVRDLALELVDSELSSTGSNIELLASKFSSKEQEDLLADEFYILVRRYHKRLNQITT